MLKNASQHDEISKYLICTIMMNILQDFPFNVPFSKI